MRQEAFNHKNLQPIDGRLANGMSVMAMAAHTGCNTVYGSTPPNNPHPYPWMNSLFQDGITVGWLLGESFIVDHGRRSVIPERLADALLRRESDVMTPRDYYEFVHFTDAVMTDQEILELPKVWVVGGDGGMGDIGYQNMSKVILQNRPNVKALMLDTQVYSNTGGQNSDSTPMLGGNDMNVFGAATQGKNIEKKTVAETFLAGHGSPFVAQVSIANAPKLYRAILDGIEYRGTIVPAVLHDVPAGARRGRRHGARRRRSACATRAARRNSSSTRGSARPTRKRSTSRAIRRSTWTGTRRSSRAPTRLTGTRWPTGARPRRASGITSRRSSRKTPQKLIPLENMLVRITQQDVVYRRYLVADHRSFVPDFGVYIRVQGENGDIEYRSLSRQLVLFCVERRKAWRMLQSKAGIENREYKAQRALLADVDGNKISKDGSVRPRRADGERADPGDRDGPQAGGTRGPSGGPRTTHTQSSDRQRVMNTGPSIIAFLVMMAVPVVSSGQGGQFIGVDDDPVLGEAGAKVTIIEFGDYQCPICRLFWKETLPRLRKEYVDTGKVKLVFRDFPLPGHPMAVPAAMATECAEDQGRFWEMHDKVYREQDRRAREGEVAEFRANDLKRWAADLKLDTAAFNSCLDSGKYKQEVAADYAAAMGVGLKGTPVFFVNGRALLGAHPFADFQKIIEEELKK